VLESLGSAHGNSYHRPAGADDAEATPFYLPTGDEVEVFEAADANRLPVLLKGPTGCGKTRFVEYMARRLGRELITVACHDDLSAADLVGRYLLTNGDTVWNEGPLTRAARTGAICYLDEVIEARRDTTVIIHSLTDHRRLLPIDKLSTTIPAHDDFRLVVSFNPGYQSAVKSLKPSTRQRFVAIEFDHPSAELETRIIAHEAGIGVELAEILATIGGKIRALADRGLAEGVSTRLLIYAGQLMKAGVPARTACRAAIAAATSDDHDEITALVELAGALFPPEIQ
jgi:nitric oxide reductase NorQ protein